MQILAEPIFPSLRRRYHSGAVPESLPQAQRHTVPSVEQEELRGISRTVAEIEWLLLILVLVYLVFGWPLPDAEPALSAAMFFFAAFVMSFRYANFYRAETRWKIAVETLAMVVFITWVLWFTGGLASPLVNAYLLVVVTSALTLGKAMTLAEVALIGSCYLFLDWQVGGKDMARLAYWGNYAAQLAPVMLVAYITTMFSADIRYGLHRAKLLSETDELTGIFNMRGFVVLANRLFAQAQRYERSASFLMVDSDNLKQVNDQHGHESGNGLLKHLVKAMQAQLRFTDVAARYGGDEFVVMLPDTPLRGALEVAERIRLAIEETPFAAEAGRVPCTVSIGVASYPEDGRSMDALLARADRALYLAKEGGRNRVAAYKAA
jgi:diguanylate cyclase (GGDEF)-like protein